MKKVVDKNPLTRKEFITTLCGYDHVALDMLFFPLLNCSIPTGYKPEISRYLQLIGILLWAVELSIIDKALETTLVITKLIANLFVLCCQASQHDALTLS